MDSGRLTGKELLKSNWDLLDGGGFVPDQAKGVPPPPLEKAAAADATLIPLPAFDALPRRGGSLLELLFSRKSRRQYSADQLGLGELAALCWAAEGVKLRRDKFTLRTAPSGGARHPLELYVYASRVEGLGAGLYRYLPIEHALCAVTPGDRSLELDNALCGQLWNAAAVFVWTAVPYRCEWRYGPVMPKLVLLDAGHSCENLYLACESLGLGTCAIGAYDQAGLDAFLGVDGEGELAVYAAPVGRPKD